MQDPARKIKVDDLSHKFLRWLTQFNVPDFRVFAAELDFCLID